MRAVHGGTFRGSEGKAGCMTTRKSHLTTAQFALLNDACIPLVEAFDEHPYLVGSATEKHPTSWRHPMGQRSRPMAGGGDATNLGGSA